MIELVIGIAALAGLVGWLLRRGGRPTRPPPERHPDIDIAELEEAEREVRNAGPATPGDGGGDVDDDWGPGAPRH